MDFFCFICYPGICICIKQPERDIYPFDLIYMVFFFEYLRKIFLTFQMFIILLFCCLLIQFKRNDIIRLQVTGKLTFYCYFIITERTGRGSCRFISNNFTATGLTTVNTHTTELIILPFSGAHRAPVFFRIFLFIRLYILGFLCALKFFDRHFRITVRTLHMLRF